MLKTKKNLDKTIKTSKHILQHHTRIQSSQKKHFIFTITLNKNKIIPRIAANREDLCYAHISGISICFVPTT